MDARGYLRALRRWRWLILLIAVTCSATAAAVSYQLPKVYKATAVGLVSPKQLIPPASNLTPGDTSQLPSIDQLIETYVALIDSGPVWDELVRSGIPRTPGQLQAEILAARQPNTTLVNITITDSDPATALTIARRIIPAFNTSLDTLQGTLGGDTSTHLLSLVPWEVPISPPDAPVSPDIPLNVLAATLAGLALGVLLAIAIERFDNSVKLPGDVTVKLGMPLLGSVMIRPAPKGATPGMVDLVAASSVQDPLSEQYRAIRTNLMFSNADKKLQSIVVTSAAPYEGKSTTASNLAVVMAQAGHKVILVDADFRRPALHHLFDRPQQPGLTNLILRDRRDNEAIFNTDVPNLRVVCAGPQPANPSELLGSQSMERVLTHLKTLADLVILDAPPVSVVTDATILSALTDGVIVVVERGGTAIPAILRAVETLRGVGANIIGAVLNKARPEEVESYYYYGSLLSEDAGAETGPAVAAVSASPAPSGGGLAAMSAPPPLGEAGRQGRGN